MRIVTYRSIFIIVSGIACIGVACQKSGTDSSVFGVAAYTVINAIPNSVPVIPLIGTSSAMLYFSNAQEIAYGGSYEYSPLGGNDTVYVVQGNGDTLNVGPKTAGLMYYNVLKLKIGSIYSLFLCGADTGSPDYVFITDTLPYHGPTDSTVGIRFVNLSAGSNPISVNLEGSGNGSEVKNLSYKAITGFKDYICNSSLTNGGYLFVVRDGVSGDSLTSFNLAGIGSGNGVGLSDPNNGNPLVFKNVTIAIYGSEGIASSNPLSMMLIDNY
jgi:hypothetical protein